MGKVRFILLQSEHEQLVKMEHIRIFSRASPDRSIAEEIDVKTCQSPSSISTVELADSNKLDRKTPGSEQKKHSLDEDGYDENEEKLCARAKLVAVSHVQLLSSSAALQGETRNTQASVKKSWLTAT